jgi:hypothetical protein
MCVLLFFLPLDAVPFVCRREQKKDQFFSSSKKKKGFASASSSECGAAAREGDPCVVSVQSGVPCGENCSANAVRREGKKRKKIDDKKKKKVLSLDVSPRVCVCVWAV